MEGPVQPGRQRFHPRHRIARQAGNGKLHRVGEGGGGGRLEMDRRVRARSPMRRNRELRRIHAEVRDRCPPKLAAEVGRLEKELETLRDLWQEADEDAAATAPA